MNSIGVNRDKVAHLRKTHPDWTLAKIAREVGVSKERVRQLLKMQGLPTVATATRVFYKTYNHPT